MRGPYERLKYDLRRLWECPLCQRHERTPGTATSRFCLCATKQEGGQPSPMKLIGDGAQRLVPVIVGRVSESEESPMEMPATVVELDIAPEPPPLTSP